MTPSVIVIGSYHHFQSLEVNKGRVRSLICIFNFILAEMSRPHEKDFGVEMLSFPPNNSLLLSFLNFKKSLPKPKCIYLFQIVNWPSFVFSSSHSFRISFLIIK